MIDTASGSWNESQRSSERTMRPLYISDGLSQFIMKVGSYCAGYIIPPRPVALTSTSSAMLALRHHIKRHLEHLEPQRAVEERVVSLVDRAGARQRRRRRC